LVDAHGRGAGAVGVEVELALLDAVLHLAACAVDALVTLLLSVNSDVSLNPLLQALSLPTTLRSCDRAVDGAVGGLLEGARPVSSFRRRL
jgi:hypothetical protein